MAGFKVAIDGPAGSGKSSISKKYSAQTRYDPSRRVPYRAYPKFLATKSELIWSAIFLDYFIQYIYRGTVEKPPKLFQSSFTMCTSQFFLM